MIIALALAALVALSLVMAGAWAIAQKTGRSGYIDAIWSFATGLIAAVLCLWPLSGHLDLRSTALAAFMLFWGTRLGSHILLRTHGAGDDPRYAALKEEWGARAPQQMFLFLQYQALAGWLLCLSAFLGSRFQTAGLSWIDGVGFAVMVAALFGERMADKQLAAFRKSAAPGSVCDSGLWGYSRHPNYVCEWLFWCGCALVGTGVTPLALHLLIWSAPLAMYLLLVHASGIPPLEAHMLRSRGEAYRAYMAHVPAFLPRPFSGP